MNPRKSAADLSPSTFNNYKRNRKLTFTALYADCVTACQNPKLTDRAVRTWLLIQPILGMNGGYLQDDVETIARKIWFEPKQVTADIEKLVKFDLLRRDDEGTVFDPVMVNDLDGVAIQNSAKFTKTLFESCLDGQGSLSKDANPKLPQYSTVPSKVGTKPTLRLGTTDCGTVPLQTSSRAGAGARPLSFGLTEADIAAAQAEFPQHDVESLLSRFVEVNEQRDGGVKASKDPLKWLKGFLKTQKGKSSKQTAASKQTASVTTTPATPATELSVPRVLPKLTAKYRKDDVNEEEPSWRLNGKALGDEYIDAMGDMPRQSRASAHKWLSKLVGFEWDTKDAFDGELAIFERHGDDCSVEGMDRFFQSQREADRIEEIVEQIEPRVEPPATVENSESDDIAHEQLMARIAAEEAALSARQS